MYAQFVHKSKINVCLYIFVELRLPPKPTTTPLPYVHTTARPRKNSQKNHHGKANHESKNKEVVFGPNQLKEDVILASEGKL